MNREQKREFIRRAKKRGVSEEQANLYLTLKSGFNTTKIKDGDKVKLDIKMIKSEKSYGDKHSEYKDFIEASEDVVYTVQIEDCKGNFVSLRENPKWLFWTGNLIPQKG